MNIVRYDKSIAHSRVLNRLRVSVNAKFTDDYIFHGATLKMCEGSYRLGEETIRNCKERNAKDRAERRESRFRSATPEELGHFSW